MKRASELQLPRAFPEVDRKIEFSDLIDGGDIIIHAAESREGHYGEFMVILAEDSEGKFTTTSGSNSVVDLIKLAFEKDELPFVAAVKERRGKTGRMYPYLS